MLLICTALFFGCLACFVCWLGHPSSCDLVVVLVLIVVVAVAAVAIAVAADEAAIALAVVVLAIHLAIGIIPVPVVPSGMLYRFVSQTGLELVFCRRFVRYPRMCFFPRFCCLLLLGFDRLSISFWPSLVPGCRCLKV